MSSIGTRKTRFLAALSCALAMLTASAIPQNAPPSAGPAQARYFARETVAQLIDQLTLLDSRAPGIDSASLYVGFIADGSSGTFAVGVLGFPSPTVPPQMVELVRRGPSVLPELVKHISDKRPTRMRVGNIETGGAAGRVGVNSFSFTYFSDEYDPRFRERSGAGESQRIPPLEGGAERDFQGSYTVNVGDICFVLIGQIVNRRLVAVRYQPSGGLVVNSPIEAPILAEKVRRDWSTAGAETLRASLLADIRGGNNPKWADQSWYAMRTLYPALERLRFYFPESYRALNGSDARRKAAFEAQESEQKTKLR
jgi:hypothetical protein